IRALSSPDFESDILSAYDAMRGAGTSVDQLVAFGPPPGVTTQEVAETLASLRRASLRGWNDAQRDQFDAALEGAERILGAHSPREALRAIEDFECNLTRCKRGTPAYDLLKHLKDDLIKDWQYALITSCYTSERGLLIEILCRFDQMYRERKR